MLVYTVTVVPLPLSLADFSGASEMLKVFALHSGGWVLSMVSTLHITRWLVLMSHQRWHRTSAAATNLPPAAAGHARLAHRLTRHTISNAPTAVVEEKARGQGSTQQLPPTHAESSRRVHRAAVREVWTTGCAATLGLLPWLGPAPMQLCVRRIAHARTPLHACMHAPPPEPAAARANTPRPFHQRLSMVPAWLCAAARTPRYPCMYVLCCAAHADV